MLFGTQVKRFNQQGLEVVKEILQDVRQGDLVGRLEGLANDSKITTMAYPGIYVEQKVFTNRRAAADYFHQQFSTIPYDKLRNDPGFWTWLSFYYFDQVCPDVDGRRKVRNDYSYVFMHDRSLYFYRHLLFIAWYIKATTPTYNRLFLNCPLHSLDKFTEEVFKRLHLTRIKCVFEVLDWLYWDREKGRPRRGVLTRNKTSPGNLITRFPTRIRQLERTYDLHCLSACQLLGLLGEEFSQYAPSQLELIK